MADTKKDVLTPFGKLSFCNLFEVISDRPDASTAFDQVSDVSALENM